MVLDHDRDMAACRKLKQDIEQTLKKVADGILLFNEFNKKMEESQVCTSEHCYSSLQHAVNAEYIHCCTCNESCRLSNHSLARSITTSPDGSFGKMVLTLCASCAHRM